jgi:1-acyl-sn-glycerol-3-phosphate acyltransferase
MLIYRIVKFFLSPFVKFLWIDSIEGLENVPIKGSVILVANHDSILDPLIMMAVCPRPIIFATAEWLFKRFFLGWLLRSTKQIEVKNNGINKEEVIAKSLEVLRRGEVFGIFPEGARSKTGLLQPAKSGVGRLALLSKASIVPIGIDDTFEIFPCNRSWPNFNKCRIKIGRPIEPINYKKYERLENGARKITDELIMPEIARLVGDPWPPKN